jgi:DNA polymerase elongation subunit (family B)
VFCVRVYGLDIETDTTINGVSPKDSSVISAAVASADGSVCEVFDAASERELLEQLLGYLEGLEPGIITTWNGSGFDLAFLVERMRIVGITHPWTLWPSARAAKYPPVGGHTVRAKLSSHSHADIAYAFKALATDCSIEWALKPMARHFGHDPVEVDRAATHLLTSSELRAYVASDAIVTAALAEHLGEGLLLWVD